MIFNIESWNKAIRDLPADVVTPVELAALDVSSGLPSQPDGADLAEIAVEIGRLRTGLRSLVARSPDPWGLPGSDLSDLGLALWALGLALHLSRRSIRLRHASETSSESSPEFSSGSSESSSESSDQSELLSRTGQPRRGSVIPVSAQILETADRIGERARKGLEELRRKHERARDRERERPPNGEAPGGAPETPEDS